MRRLANVISFVVLSLSLASGARAQESPLTVDGATTIQAAMAKTLFDRGVSFVDVRPNDRFEVGHIPEATHLDLFTAFNEASLLKVAAKDQEVVIYCDGPGCKRSSKGCAKAVSWGFEKVYYFRGGFPEWQAAGLPTDPP